MRYTLDQQKASTKHNKVNHSHRPVVFFLSLRNINRKQTSHDTNSTQENKAIPKDIHGFAQGQIYSDDWILGDEAKPMLRS